MNELKPSVWHKAWNEPRRFFFWLTLFLFVVGACFAISAIPHRSPPPVCFVGVLVTAFFFLLAFIGLILAFIPWTRPLMDWLLRRRFFVLASIITVIALFYAEEDWRGRRAWEAYKQQEAARGEYFDFAHIIPPPVPDDQNFAMTPLLKPEYDFQHTTNGLVWNDTNALARLRRAGVESLPDKAGDSKAYPDTADIFKGTLANMDKWQAYFQNNTNFPQLDRPGSRAEAILFALDKFKPELDELQQAAATRPFSRFPIEYNHTPPTEIMLPHLSDIKGLERLACVRSIAHLEAGQTNAAFDDLKLSLRISDSIKDEPILIDHLVRLATLNIALNGFYEGLNRHAWNDAQLAELESNLSSINLLAELKQALRGERVFGVVTIDWLRQQSFQTDLSAAFGSGTLEEQYEPINLLPKSFFYFNMLNVAKVEESLFTGFDENTHRIFVNGEYKKAMASIGANDKKHIHPFSMFAQLILPAVSKASQKPARTQTYVDLAVVACGLERYHLAHGNYPDSIDALTPQFITNLPHDIINGQPLHYRQTSEGYVLYSVGWNQKDDGGIVAFKKSSDSDSQIVDPEQGDWVWQMPGKVTP